MRSGPPLAAIGDKALAWVGDLALRMGRDTLHGRSPKFIGWLGAECCREQARRRGEAVPEAEAFWLDTLSTDELLALGELCSQMALAARQLGATGIDEQGRRSPDARPPLAADDELPVLEVVGLFQTLTQAARLALAARPAPMETLH